MAKSANDYFFRWINVLRGKLSSKEAKYLASPEFLKEVLAKIDNVEEMVRSNKTLSTENFAKISRTMVAIEYKIHTLVDIDIDWDEEFGE